MGERPNASKRIWLAVGAGLLATPASAFVGALGYCAGLFGLVAGPLGYLLLGGMGMLGGAGGTMAFFARRVFRHLGREAIYLRAFVLGAVAALAALPAGLRWAVPRYDGGAAAFVVLTLAIALSLGVVVAWLEGQRPPKADRGTS